MTSTSSKTTARLRLQFAVLLFVCAGVFPFLATATAAQEPLSDMLERTMPAVVHVESETTVLVPRRGQPRHPLLERFFGDSQPPLRERKRGGSASGVIISAELGRVITNHHVVAGADSIIIALSDGRRYEAKLVGADPETDIAILEIDADNLTDIPLGNSEKLRVGDEVFAVGSPFGLSQTVTSGIVSALSRSGLGIESYEDFIQTDAAINRGNSGGALINRRGELIGINTAILGAAGGNVGIGFAIPINMVTAIADQLLETGRVRRGQLGIAVQVLTAELAKAFGVERRRGIIIAQVRPGSSAEAAGLRAGDIITSVNGRPIENHRQIKSYIGLRRIGEKVTMGVLRGGEEMEFEAIISARELRDMSGDNLGSKFSGLLLENFVPERSGVAEGVVIKNIRKNSHAYHKGLRVGDVILSVNGQRVLDLEELGEAVSTDDDTVALLIKRRGRSIFVAL